MMGHDYQIKGRTFQNKEKLLEMLQNLKQTAFIPVDKVDEKCRIIRGRAGSKKPSHSVRRYL